MLKWSTSEISRRSPVRK